jgi:Transcription factor WhiB
VQRDVVGLADVQREGRTVEALAEQVLYLHWALDRGVTFGIWGGATEDERRAMSRALVPPRSSR